MVLLRYMPTTRKRPFTEPWSPTPKDLTQLRALGISPAQVRSQIALLRQARHHRHLDRPCTLGDGIHRIPRAEARSLIPLQEEAARAASESV